MPKCSVPSFGMTQISSKKEQECKNLKSRCHTCYPLILLLVWLLGPLRVMRQNYDQRKLSVDAPSRDVPSLSVFLPKSCQRIFGSECWTIQPWERWITDTRTDTPDWFYTLDRWRGREQTGHGFLHYGYGKGLEVCGNHLIHVSPAVRLTCLMFPGTVDSGTWY